MARQSETSLRRAPQSAPPVISRSLLRWFLRYAPYYVSRHMHAVRISEQHNLEQVAGRPLLLYMNHPSWWDPMIAAVLAARYLPDYAHYTPIDAVALEKYRFFTKLGFFGMARNSFESQRRLIDIAAQVLNQPRSALWITPQGRFTDVRERPLRIGSGLPHLVRRARACAVIPIAIEYSFWEESKPEVLVRVGQLMDANEIQGRSDEQEFLERRLQETLDLLSRAAIMRDQSAFSVILSGNSGVGGVYDLWRRAMATVKGSRFRPEHGGSHP